MSIKLQTYYKHNKYSECIVFVTEIHDYEVNFTTISTDRPILDFGYAYKIEFLYNFTELNELEILLYT